MHVIKTANAGQPATQRATPESDITGTAWCCSPLAATNSRLLHFHNDISTLLDSRDSDFLLSTIHAEIMANADVLLPASSADITAQSTALRAELKEWERAFAAANGGKKAGRDDIKQNPEIGMFRSSLPTGLEAG